jgi:hypothetical protein
MIVPAFRAGDGGSELSGVAGAAAPVTPVHLLEVFPGRTERIAATGKGSQVKAVAAFGKIGASRYMHLMISVRLGLLVDVVMLHCAPPEVVDVTARPMLINEAGVFLNLE